MTAPELAPNSNVAGKYTILSLMGMGGSSATYHAVAADGREVALKIFDPAIRQRADIMAAIEQTYAATNALSPEIVIPLLDAGYDPVTGAPFSVTERIPFPSLAQLMAQRPLTADELVQVLTFLGRALDAAHARQLCHHAIKPTNIFVGFAQGYGVRITDFGAGLARAAVPTHEGYSQSAPWLAPEQVQGTVPAGAAADVFAAALVAFAALTGRSYWRSLQGGAPDLAAWQQELLSQRTPPSVRARELGVAFPPAFDVVLGAALALDPGQRYRSVGELAAALEALSSNAKAPPESAATMAFPSNVLLGNAGPGGGEYPPPPTPLGGMGMPAQAQQPQGYPGQPQQPQQPQGYAAPPNQPEPPRGDAGRKPTMEISVARRPTSNKAAPFLVGLVVLVLVLGGAAAWVLLGRGKGPSGTDATAASGSPSASAAASAVPSAVASAEPVAVPPPDVPSAEPAAPSATPSASASAAPGEPELTVLCEPDCEEVKIDGKVADITKPVPLTPGKHTVIGTKSGYTSASEVVTMAAGKTTESHLKLKEKVAGPGPGPGPGPGTSTGSGGGGNKPKCGKFIKTNCVK